MHVGVKPLQVNWAAAGQSGATAAGWHAASSSGFACAPNQCECPTSHWLHCTHLDSWMVTSGAAYWPMRHTSRRPSQPRLSRRSPSTSSCEGCRPWGLRGVSWCWCRYPRVSHASGNAGPLTNGSLRLPSCTTSPLISSPAGCRPRAHGTRHCGARGGTPLSCRAPPQTSGRPCRPAHRYCASAAAGRW